MPDRRYWPLRQPPRPVDRFAAHYAEAVLSAWWVIMGTGVLWTTIANPPVTSVFVRVADEVGVPLGGTLLIAGAGLLWSTLTSCPRVSLVWDVQQSAFILAAVAWGTYAVTVWGFDPWNWVAYGHGSVMTAVAAVGFITSKVSERLGRRDVREAGGLA